MGEHATHAPAACCERGAVAQLRFRYRPTLLVETMGLDKSHGGTQYQNNSRLDVWADALAAALCCRHHSMDACLRPARYSAAIQAHA